ncbi:hypothetical protein FH972_014999 [Carpinus fangiana]|uniref:Uncharacterized protein n=1 Tax=Carpinus fangiana TaxID=176857 RepID=A0A5N6RF14_9ROSI|nr:hypothetical protein FH972_014999 [Carpinus fangiana]
MALRIRKVATPMETAMTGTQKIRFKILRRHAHLSQQHCFPDMPEFRDPKQSNNSTPLSAKQVVGHLSIPTGDRRGLERRELLVTRLALEDIARRAGENVHFCPPREQHQAVRHGAHAIKLPSGHTSLHVWMRAVSDVSHLMYGIPVGQNIKLHVHVSCLVAARVAINMCLA